ncbi:M23 family metallopeptidase [Niabella sp. CJ426]|uniref:M23 family metallopeptidase n=1 Tax=Niabella sp. CJ426 TaxID=3393740 RepID=UPI003CFF45C9
MPIFYIFIAISFCYPSWGQLNTIDRHGTLRSQSPNAIKDSSKIGRMLDTIGLRVEKKTITKPIGKISAPLNVIQITSGFGVRKHPVFGRLRRHNGIDLKAHFLPVYSIADGMVVKSDKGVLEGNFLVVAHGALQSIYCHLHTSFVEPGQTIRAGEIIGVSGNTGTTSGPHLHFGLKYNNRFIDPEPFLKLFMPDR